jgi:hypothetical protein
MSNLVNILLYIILLGLFGAPFLFKSIAEPLFAKTSYFFMLVIFAWWLFASWGHFKGKIRTLFSNKELRNPFIIALVATAFCFITNEVAFKVNSDETNLMGISHSMFFNKEVYNETMGKYYYGNLNVINIEIPKRPLFFPFLTNVVHNLIGYSYYSPFIVNFIFLWGIFFIAITGFKQFTMMQKLAVTFLILSQPVFAIYGTSAGFDIASFFFLLLSLKLAFDYKKSPRPETWTFLIATLAVFVNIRYESILFAGLIILYLWYLKATSFKELFTDHKLKFFVFLYFPQLLQRILSVGNYENPEDRGVFSLIALKEHTQLMGRFLTDFFGILPYNSFINLLAPFVIAWLLYRVVKDRKINHLGFIAGITLINTLLFLAHHAGIYDHPTQARFFFYYIGFAIVGYLYLFDKLKLKHKDGYLLISSIVMFILFNPTANEGRFMNKLVINRDLRHIYTFIRKQPEPNILYIYDRPGQIVALNKGAVTYEYAKENWEGLLSNLESGLFSRIVVIDEAYYKNKAKGEYNKSPAIELGRYQSTGSKYIRILEIMRP